MKTKITGLLNNEIKKECTKTFNNVRLCCIFHVHDISCVSYAVTNMWFFVSILRAFMFQMKAMPVCPSASFTSQEPKELRLNLVFVVHTQTCPLVESVNFTKTLHGPSYVTPQRTKQCVVTTGIGDALTAAMFIRCKYKFVAAPGVAICLLCLLLHFVAQHTTPNSVSNQNYRFYLYIMGLQSFL
jgi:hypothetical protein